MTSRSARSNPMALSITLGAFLALATMSLHPAWAQEPDHGITPAAEIKSDQAARVREAGESALATGADPVARPNEDRSLHAGDVREHEEAAAGEPDGLQEERGPQPFEIVRSLQFLQDQAARGNAAAIRVQAMLLRRYGPTFRDADGATWQDPRNIRAAALFVLSGGPPSVLSAILAKIDPAGAEATLLNGALAYVQNRVGEAERLLGSLDTRFMESALAAQVDLAVAQLQQERKPSAALDRLRQVMLAAPGTLLDEAAHRMGVVLAEEAGRHELADRLARQYFDRYSDSVYAGNFRARFAAIYAGRAEGTEVRTVATIADATHAISGDQQLAIFLAVSRRALVEGSLTLAARTAEKALTYADASPADRQRALLYEIAATLPERDAVEARATLEAIDPKRLHPSDVELRDAAFEVLGEIRRPLVADAGVTPPSPPSAADPDQLSATLERGRALLQATRNDISKERQ